ncbi:hypothetical protein GC207_14880 [bacterium]|nr:hypothetical protein [bacterium]
MKQVNFDESGNTGQNLLDDGDPVFVLASCSLTASQTQEAFAHFLSFQGPELKFARLRKSASGQRSILDFLNSPAVTSATAAAVLIHKPYMVVTKYCDLVLEPSMRQTGIDFYARGRNIATGNLLTTVMPTYLNPRSWSNFLSMFVRVIRERTANVFRDWQTSAEIIHAHLAHNQPQMADFIAPILAMRHADEFFAMLSDDELDPLLTSYHFMANHWGSTIGDRFEIIADESKVLAKEKERLLKLSDPNLKETRVGYDRRTIEYPLKVADIMAVDSKAHRQVQCADILAGAIACACKVRVKGPLVEGTFAHDVLRVCFDKGLVVDGLWPSQLIDPSALGTDTEPGKGDIDAATYNAMILQGHPVTRNRET